MLARGVLLAVQRVVGFMAMPRLLEALPPFDGLSIFAYAVLAGLGLVGLAPSAGPADTRQPSGATWMAAILVALAGALLITFRGSLPRGAAQRHARFKR